MKTSDRLPNSKVPSKPGEGLLQDDDPPIDINSLIRRWDNDLELVALFLEKFRRVAAGELARLHGLVADGKTLEAEQVAHGLKGAASYVSATGVQKLVAEIESLCHRSERPGLETLLEQLDTEVRRCLDAIPSALNSMQRRST